MNKKTLALIMILVFSVLTFSQDTGKKTDEKSNETSQVSSKGKSVDYLNFQIKNFKNKRGFEVNYDRFDDSTLVGFDGFELMGFGESVGKLLATANKADEPPSLMMKLYFGFDSNKLSNNIEKFVLVFTSNGTEWRFLKNRDLFAIADEERIKFGEGDLASADIKLGRISGINLKETVSFVISREQLRKLSEAKSLEIRIGNREQKLKDKHKQMFKDMLVLATVSEEITTEK